MMKTWLQSKSGGVSVEMSFMLLIMVALTGGTIEAGYAYFQWNGVQQAARHGARLAATSEPVALGLNTMTGLGNGVEAGDPMPDYTFNCSGKTNSCNSGSYNAAAMNKIFFGPDNDGNCAVTEPDRRGMCDVFSDIEKKNVKVIYAHSGLGTAGYPANPAPLITVKVTELKFDFVLLDLFTPDSFSTMPDVSVSVMAEDLRSGS